MSGPRPRVGSTGCSSSAAWICHGGRRVLDVVARELAHQLPALSQPRPVEAIAQRCEAAPANSPLVRFVTQELAAEVAARPADQEPRLGEWLLTEPKEPSCQRLATFWRRYLAAAMEPLPADLTSQLCQEVVDQAWAQVVRPGRGY